MCVGVEYTHTIIQVSGRVDPIKACSPTLHSQQCTVQSTAQSQKDSQLLRLYLHILWRDPQIEIAWSPATKPFSSFACVSASPAARPGGVCRTLLGT